VYGVIRRIIWEGEIMSKRIQGFIVGTVFGSLLLTGGIALAKTATETLSVEYRDIKIVVDGYTVTPKDGNGAPVEPFIVNGTTYLPVRAVAQAMNSTVSWDAATSTVTINTAGYSGVPATTPTQPPLPPVTNAAQNGTITEAQAKQVALNQAGVTEADTSWIRAKLDWDDGRQHYDVDFVVGTREYEYEINATTGKIISYSNESMYD
jgi:uncharacterized membrane protein YkoI